MTDADHRPARGPLADVRVIDMATLLAAPEAARHLADFGADVIKVEAPSGDPARRLGWFRPGDHDSLFWRLVGRGKRSAVLDLKHPAGLDAMLRLVDTAHVLIENLRPGKLERLGLPPDVLHERNPRLVVLRVTGFGQTGPYAMRPGYASLAEAMSGWAAISGLPDGQPLLPPIALTDEVTAMLGAFAVMVALRHAEHTGEGQVIDLSLSESMLSLMGPLPSAYAHLGYLQPRLGAGIPFSVPRGTYQCSDGVWVAVATSSDSIAGRVLGLLGIADDPRFSSFQKRMAKPGGVGDPDGRLDCSAPERCGSREIRISRRGNRGYQHDGRRSRGRAHAAPSGDHRGRRRADAGNRAEDAGRSPFGAPCRAAARRRHRGRCWQSSESNCRPKSRARQATRQLDASRNRCHQAFRGAYQHPGRVDLFASRQGILREALVNATGRCRPSPTVRHLSR